MLLLHVVYTTRPLCAHLLCQLLRAGAAFDVFQGGGEMEPPLDFFYREFGQFYVKTMISWGWKVEGRKWVCKIWNFWKIFIFNEKVAPQEFFFLLDQFFKHQNWWARRCLLSPLVLLIFQGGGSSTPSFPGRDVPPIFLGPPPPPKLLSVSIFSSFVQYKTIKKVRGFKNVFSWIFKILQKSK